MYVTGLDRWLFVSYRRDMLGLIAEVQADTEAQDSIRTVVESFAKQADELHGWLAERFGGTYLEQRAKEEADFVF